jgi:hypothetical protein
LELNMIDARLSSPALRLHASIHRCCNSQLRKWDRLCAHGSTCCRSSGRRAASERSWNVRNFGGSALIEGDVGGTALRRTAGETQAVVQFVNAKLLTT